MTVALPLHGGHHHVGCAPLCGFPFFLLRTLSLLSPTFCNIKLKDESIAGTGNIKGHHDLVFKTVAHM